MKNDRATGFNRGRASSKADGPSRIDDDSIMMDKTLLTWQVIHVYLAIEDFFSLSLMFDTSQ